MLTRRRTSCQTAVSPANRVISGHGEREGNVLQVSKARRVAFATGLFFIATVAATLAMPHIAQGQCSPGNMSLTPVDTSGTGDAVILTLDRDDAPAVVRRVMCYMQTTLIEFAGATSSFSPPRPTSRRFGMRSRRRSHD